MNMNNKNVLKYILLFGCLIAVGLLMARFVKSDSPEDMSILSETAAIRDFDIMVNTIGTLDAERSFMISSSVRGDKGRIIYLIDDGTKVENDTVLIKLDPTPFEEEVRRLKEEVIGLETALESAQQILEWEKNQMEREIRAAEYNLKISRIELKKLIEGDGPLQLSQYKEEVEKVREEYERYLAYISDLETLSERGYSNHSEIAMAKKKASELKEKYEAAVKKYSSYKEHVYPSSEQTANAKVEKAEIESDQIRKGSVFKIAKSVSVLNETKSRLQHTKNSLIQAQDELNKTTIKAPFAGIVVLNETFMDGQKRKPRTGDRVLQNQPLLYLPDISSMIVKTQVREIDLHKISIGQKCSIRTDAYPDTMFGGEITFLGTLASGREGMGGEKYFQLTVALKGENSKLRPGMTARVSILADQVKNCLTIPVHAIFEEGGKKYCYKALGKKFGKIRISVGRQNEDMAEIISGITKGDRISLVRPPSDSIGQ